MLPSKQTLRNPHFTPHSINSTWMFEVFGLAGENALSPFLTESASERVVERQNERLSFLIDRPPFPNLSITISRLRFQTESPPEIVRNPKRTLSRRSPRACVQPGAL
jgi:hypothetical protein